MKHRVLLLASGRSKRLGDSVPKQFHRHGGLYLFEYSLRTFLNHPSIDSIAVVLLPEQRRFLEERPLSVVSQKSIEWINGGEERFESVYAGLSHLVSTPEAISSLGEENVLIHDSARPFVTTETLTRCVEALENYQAVSVATSLNDTPLQVIQSPFIEGSLDRNQIRRCQTPQCFRLGAIKTAYDHFMKTKDFVPTDDTSIYRRVFEKEPMVYVEGGDINFKVTTPLDMKLFHFLVDDLDLRKH